MICLSVSLPYCLSSAYLSAGKNKLQVLRLTSDRPPYHSDFEKSPKAFCSPLLMASSSPLFSLAEIRGAIDGKEAAVLAAVENAFLQLSSGKAVVAPVTHLEFDEAHGAQGTGDTW